MSASSVLNDGGADGTRPRHIPVLLAEVIGALVAGPGARVIDGTFGAGGYTAAILEAVPDCSVMAIDRDPTAIAGGRALAEAYGGRLDLVEGRFGDLDQWATERRFGPVTGVMLDIGVSSMQIDDPERGFSFRNDGPLDMRMERAGPSAADLVNTMEEGALADLIYLYGEERRSRAVARAIVAERRVAPILTTRALANLVASVVRLPPDAIHPATRTFQALRLAVNDELGELERALQAAEAVLAPGGRLAVVTFHSLEDRIVKQFMVDRSGEAPGPSRHLPGSATLPSTFVNLTRRPISPGHSEITVNPRARSARLRIAERTAVAARSPDRAGRR